MNRITIGLSIMAGSIAAMIVLLITDSHDLWMGLFALLSLLAGSIVMTDGWLPRHSRRKPLRKSLSRTVSPLMGPGTATRPRPPRETPLRW